MLKHIPIDSFFKYRHEPIYIVSLEYTYKELARLYKIVYEEWVEDGVIFIVEDERYFIKASNNPDKPYNQIVVYVQAGFKCPVMAVKTFLIHLKFQIQ